MKISKWEALLCLAAAAFIAFFAGWFLRDVKSAQPLSVQTSRTLTETNLTLSPPTPEPRPETVNINTATAEELKGLPGIGEKRAADIVRDREENGPFRIPEDITRIDGIGEETLAGVLDYITAE